MINGTPRGYRMSYKISRGCYRVMEWREVCWMPIARDVSYKEARELVAQGVR